MRWTPRAVRIGVVVALGLPAFVILMTGRSHAQFPKGGPKPPIMQPPQPPIMQPPGPMVLVWTCPKCGKEIGRGAFPPANCQFCGQKIANGIGPANPGNPQPPVNPFPQPPVNPFPQPPVNPNPGQPGLAGTTWAGSETLLGYGALTFQFQPGGQATMIDKHGNTPGNWTQVGNTVTLTFGAVTYSGSIQGNRMSGSARDPNNNWTWNVSNPQFNQAANPPPIVNPPPADIPPAAVPVDNPRPSRTGVVVFVIAGVVFVGLGIAILGGGIFFLVKMTGQEKAPKRRRRSRDY